MYTPARLPRWHSWIARPPPKGQVAGSNPARGTNSQGPAWAFGNWLPWVDLVSNCRLIFCLVVCSHNFTSGSAMLAAQFLCLPFADLTTTQLYALLRLRSEVFVVEQVCPFQDMDNCDQQALHVLGYRGEELLCYARLLPRGSKYDAVSIGRVVSAASVRRDGFGRALMSHCIAQCQQRWPDQDIIISAQQYLEEFYRSFGFTKVEVEAAVDERCCYTFQGGELSGLRRMREFMYQRNALATYEETRNEISGQDNSSKLSPWISNGCLSVRFLYKAVKEYE